MTQGRAREEGVLVGTSSGLNIAAAVQMARELGPGRVVATYPAVPRPTSP